MCLIGRTSVALQRQKGNRGLFLAIPPEEALVIRRREFNRQFVIPDRERATATDLLRTEDDQHPSASLLPGQAVPGKSTAGLMTALASGQGRKPQSKVSSYHTTS